MSALIRLVTAEDADALQQIYAPFVLDTAVSFEVEPPDEDEMRARITSTLTRLPWLVCEHQGQPIGYVYAGPHRQRAAYGWSVDVAAYIHEQYRGQGVGKALYTSLFPLLRLQGYYNAYAGITLPNAASVGLHEAMGFRPVGVYTSVGYKAGRWHDVGWWQLALQPHADAPQPPRDLPSIQDNAEWEAALRAGESCLRV